MNRRAEVVVAALILLVVIGLVLPPVVRVREAAGRMGCINNLKSLGLGLQGYQDWCEHFPAGTIENTDLPPDRRLSWHVELYGFMIGGRELLLDKGLPWDAPENRDPKYRVPKDNDRVEVIGQLGWLTCPSNPNRGEAGRPGLAHYVGVAGVGEDAAWLPVEDRRAGVFGYDRKTRPGDIKDGPSTTLVVIETDADNGPWTAGGRATVRGLEPGRSPYLGRGGQFGGRHRGGVTNALFADGSVRPLGAAMSAEVFEALATIAGGEDVGQAGDW
jgi:prepilin-type processing-associated H-X9-DG protein